MDVGRSASTSISHQEIMPTFPASNQVAATRMSCKVYEAAEEGKMDILQGIERLDKELTPNKNTVLHIHIRGGMASKDCVIDMVRKCPSLLQKTNNKDETPLHMAAREGLTEIVKALVEQVNASYPNDADLESGKKLAVREMIGMRNKEEDTALHEAVRYRQLDVVKSLIEADPEFEYCRNRAGETPLYMAVKRGFDELVDEILKTCKTPAHYQGPNSLTALHEAIICSDAKGEVGRKILEKMPDLATETDDNGWTPLHYAAYFGKVSQAKALLKRNESAAYIADKDGKTPLHIAASRNHAQMMKKLISCCPDCSELVDNRGRNVLHLAVQTRGRQAMELILKNSWGSNLINDKDADGNTPLHMFASFLSFVPTLMLSHPRVDKMAVNNNGLTAANILSSNTQAPLLKALVLLVHKLKLTKIFYFTPARPSVTNDHDRGAKDRVSEIKKASKTHLIVAALIATVAFAAGFTLPGGYKGEKGSHRGMAVLASKATFIAFYITDGMAMLLSTVAIVIHFIMTVHEDQEQLYCMFKWASYSTLFAMVAMLAAFAMAACAVLFNNHSGAIVILAALMFSPGLVLCYLVYPRLKKLKKI
ncbi:hypothetical protein PVL29_006046 [Vitis rotundifolia]|uniref:PGG domain-containing protein n=1 Tax=Vitis rotundifolia TaxID=103349 RepID=A0AA39A4E4_VITRO|nr:hypothetical protein PVL29_006046 [Vitis rotundifolia]